MCKLDTLAGFFFRLSLFSNFYSDFFFAVLPTESPIINGAKLRYSIGDIVDVNCTSSNSKPAADIRWLINGKPVSLSTCILHIAYSVSTIVVPLPNRYSTVLIYWFYLKVFEERLYIKHCIFDLLKAFKAWFCNVFHKFSHIG